jgi:hypothetical protein
MVQTNYSNSWNRNFLIMTECPGNSTHYGPVTLDVMADIPVVLVNIIVESENRKFLDHTVKACQLFNGQRVGFIANLYKNYVKLVDKRLFRCPIKKGKYVLLAAREFDFFNIMKITGDVPSFIPTRGKYFIKFNGRTVLGKKTINLYKSTESYEFLAD